MHVILKRIALALCGITVLTGADWPQFRGDNRNSVADAGKLPTTWNVQDGTNVAWKADLSGKGVSSPIVVGGKVIVTADSGIRRDRLHVFCFNADTGAKEWERQFWATGRTFCHPTSAVAANTPASDGERIFAFYSSNDLACLDLKGNLLWYRGLTHDYPASGNDVGMSSSPLSIGDVVVVQVECQGDSFAAGLDAATGETRWRIERQRGANWVSPVALRGETPADDVVLLQAPEGISAHDPATGKELWSHKTACNIIPSAAALDNVIYVPSNGLTALKREPGSQNLQVLWQQNEMSPGNASPLVHDGLVYFVKSKGVLGCGDAETGAKLWEARLGGTFWATPLIAGDLLYEVNQEGVAYVVRIGREGGEVVSENDFGEQMLGSPAAADGALYFRSDAHLWKIAETK
jgi:outer membrane protein assembly factor BamB